MISNHLNTIEGLDPETDMLKKIGNRIKTLRIRAGHLNYEKFAFQNNIGRMLLRRAEKGSNINVNNLLRIINALGMTLPEFFGDGFD